MAETVLNYKCSSCGAPLAYDGDSGKLICESCGSRFDLDDVRKAQTADDGFLHTEPTRWDRTGSAAWDAEESSHLKSYVCPSCGAEIIADDTTAATQ